MTLTPLVIIGAAGTGRETLDIVDAINREAPRFELLGVLDDFPAEIQLERLEKHGTPYLGTVQEWLGKHEGHVYFAVAIADPHIRQKLAAAMEAAGHRPATLIHPRAIIGSWTAFGAGTIVYGGAQVSTNVTIGAHAIVNMNVCIGHDCVIGDFVSVNPGATISGEVAIQNRVLVGGRSTILQGLIVGADALVGAAALVTKDVPDAVTVKGMPGRW